MRGVLKRGLLFVSGLVMILGLGSGLATAQTAGSAGNGFRVSPVRSEFVIDKGATESMTITVENPTDGTVIAKPIVNDFVASDKEDGEPRLILDDKAPKPRNSFKDLVRNLPDLQLGPRQKKDLQVNISVPKGGNAGGYYGAVRFVPAGTAGSGNVGLTASVGTIILVKVPGDLNEKLSLVQLGAAQGGKVKGFMRGGNVTVLTRLKNVGDIHVQPFGKVTIKSMFGKTVKEFELNATDPRANILPDSTRKFEDAIEKPGRGWFGRYTIAANIGYSQGSGDLISTTKTFWYLPTWFLILIVVLILAIVGAVLYFVKFRGGGGRRGRRGRGVNTPHSPSVRRF
ncbi:MAG TPA: hypothetical protein VK694_03230 [Verrucomicrobiae bacterium]|nr:hypothetical protein [Verrucomicrobiae bacterium]